MMKPKILVLCVAAAVLAAAYLASPAGAVTLCKEAKNPCPEASRYPAGTKISGALKEKTHWDVTTSIGTVTCTVSNFSETSNATSGNPHVSTLTSITFTGCTLGSTKCTVVALHLPWKVTRTSGFLGIGNGTKVIESDGSGTPQYKVECGSFMNCTFGSSSISFSTTGGSPARETVNQSLEREGGLCPSTATWTAEYTISAPSPLFITAEP
jgi:hypothetical protein